MKKNIFFIFAFIYIYSLQAQQWGDYTLYSVQNSSTAYLVDTNGTNFKTWTFSSTAKTGYSSYLMPGGTLWRTVINTSNVLTGGGMTGRIQKVDYSGTVLWDYSYSSSNYCLHHDICPLPNGNVLVISYDVKSSTDVANAGCTFVGSVWSEKIMELQPVGSNAANVVWEWKFWDHICQDQNSSLPNYVSSIVNNPQLLNVNYNAKKDWIHMNGIDYNPMLDQIALSSHNLNEWYIIDHSTTTTEAASHSGGNAGKGGDLLYRWGNPAAYQASGTTYLNVTHDAHWIPEGVPNAGWLVGFNNKGISSTQSCVDMVSTPRVAYNYTITPGQAYGPTIYNQRINVNGYTSNMGNSQQLPNGNHHVALATAGIIKEIDASANLLWTKTATGNIPQSFRYNSCYVNNAAPAIPVISFNGSDLVASSATTYQWYYNGDLIAGANAQNYTPTQDGIYVVRITDANGCVYQYSTGFAYNSGMIGIENNNPESTLLYFPNPSTGILYLKNNTKSEFTVRIMDAIGNIVFEEKNPNTIDMSELANGVYYLLHTQNEKSQFQKIILSK
jgi:hypothetical protein